VPQFALAALLAALGLDPSRAKVQTAFKKWALLEPNPLRLTTHGPGGEWKMRDSTKVMNLSFYRAPTSVPANLHVYAEGLLRLGIVQPSANPWKGEFSVEQWAALLELGKGLMAPAPRVAPSAPSASTGQAATAATSAASTSALAPAAFAFPQPAAAWQSAGPPPGQMMQLSRCEREKLRCCANPRLRRKAPSGRAMLGQNPAAPPPRPRARRVPARALGARALTPRHRLVKRRGCVYKRDSILWFVLLRV